MLKGLKDIFGISLDAKTFGGLSAGSCGTGSSDSSTVATTSPPAVMAGAGCSPLARPIPSVHRPLKIHPQGPQNRQVKARMMATAQRGFEFTNRTRSIQWTLVKSNRPPLPED